MSTRPRATASPEFADTGGAVVVQELRNPITGMILRATSLNRAIDRTRTWSQIKPCYDADALARMLAGNRALYEQCREQGGTLYPFAAVAMSRGDWERHYGEHLQALRKAKHRYDPANVFSSGPVELFPEGNYGA
jgi:FAD/FMN-containing dehydrogenase